MKQQIPGQEEYVAKRLNITSDKLNKANSEAETERKKAIFNRIIILAVILSLGGYVFFLSFQQFQVFQTMVVLQHESVGPLAVSMHEDNSHLIINVLLLLSNIGVVMKVSGNGKLFDKKKPEAKDE